ncbi:MAG: hypothetical protein NUW37_17510 [Planctomycetes bacterium]|nr:hypothetical protein [Planctomycetota bacterium]
MTTMIYSRYEDLVHGRPVDYGEVMSYLEVNNSKAYYDYLDYFLLWDVFNDSRITFNIERNAVVANFENVHGINYFSHELSIDPSSKNREDIERAFLFSCRFEDVRYFSLKQSKGWFNDYQSGVAIRSRLKDQLDHGKKELIHHRATLASDVGGGGRLDIIFRNCKVIPQHRVGAHLRKKTIDGFRKDGYRRMNVAHLREMGITPDQVLFPKEFWKEKR